MRALCFSLVALAILATSAVSGDIWSIEYSRGLPAKQRGDLAINLTPGARFNHAFLEPGEVFFRDRIPGTARVELVYQVTEAAGTIWYANPGGESVPHEDVDGAPPRIGIVLQRDWNTPSGRWFSIARHDLRPGTYRLLVPIEGWAWKNVNGKFGNESAKHKEMFRRTWTEHARIGLCAGGFFHAHGIEVLSGSATIRVLSLRVRPRRRRAALTPAERHETRPRPRRDRRHYPPRPRLRNGDLCRPGRQ